MQSALYWCSSFSEIKKKNARWNIETRYLFKCFKFGQLVGGSCPDDRAKYSQETWILNLIAFRTPNLVLSQVSFYCLENETHTTRTGKTDNVYRIMVRKLLSKIPLLRARKREKRIRWILRTTLRRPEVKGTGTTS